MGRFVEGLGWVVKASEWELKKEPRKFNSKEEALRVLALVKIYPKGTIPDWVIEEAKRTLE